MEKLNQIHLWEFNHPYYCTEDNFFKSGDNTYPTRFKFDSFDEFIEKCDNMDMDYNLLFRWDWSEDDTLTLFFFLQRKGYLMTINIKVKKEDEENVKLYLTKRGEYIKLLWNPILD